MLFGLREIQIVNHSWVNSSMTLSILNRLRRGAPMDTHDYDA